MCCVPVGWATPSACAAPWKLPASTRATKLRRWTRFSIGSTRGIVDGAIRHAACEKLQDAVCRRERDFAPYAVHGRSQMRRQDGARVLGERSEEHTSELQSLMRIWY